MTMKRVKGSVFTVPIVHGSVAEYLGEDATDAKTHRWTVYLRPFHNALISHFIGHVEFLLHDSFSDATRRVSQMPYEVTEYGWGEFEVVITIVFHDSAEKPVELFHPLHLFHSNQSVSNSPVVVEFYDEIVFQDPTEKMLNLLKTTPHGPSVSLNESSCAKHYTDFSNTENSTLKSIEAARTRLREEARAKQQRYEQLEEERASLVKELNVHGINA